MFLLLLRKIKYLGVGGFIKKYIELIQSDRGMLCRQTRRAVTSVQTLALTYSTTVAHADRFKAIKTYSQGCSLPFNTYITTTAERTSELTALSRQPLSYQIYSEAETPGEVRSAHHKVRQTESKCFSLFFHKDQLREEREKTWPVISFSSPTVFNHL